MESGDIRAGLQILGPMVLVHPEANLSAPTTMLRRLSALFVAQGGIPLSRSEIADVLWAGVPPASARGTLHAYLSRLRKLFGPRCVRYEAGHCMFSRSLMSLDCIQFRALATKASTAKARGGTVSAVAAASAGRSLWRGAAFHGFHDLSR